MSDGLYAPKPLTPTTELGRLLLSLEVPDCPCVPEAVQSSWKVCQNPRRCPGQYACAECPYELFSPPCPHVLAADHGLSIDEWAALLLLYDYEGYADPPAPPPAIAVTKEARLALYCNRAAAGLGIGNHRSQTVEDLDEVSVESLPFLREGGIVTSRRQA